MSRDRPHILIVDDDRGTRRTTALILDRKGYAVETAENGPEAIERVQAKPFDVIFLDIKMPVMNGVETHRRIKDVRPDALVVMMTAYAVEDMVQQALNDGAHGILHKPLDIERLVEIVERAKMTKTGALVMVVDDSVDIRSMLKEALTDEGHEVGAASTGEEAVALARERSHDVLFIDLKLPTINGLETYLKVRKVNPKAIAVIMTGYPVELSDLAQEAVEKDAYGLLHKPFDVEDVLTLVQEVTNR
jgi:DNA-binding NtrC family response regulator